MYPDKSEDHRVASDERDDFAVVVPFDFENFRIEDREVVGTTAIIDVDERKISPTEGPRPKMYPNLFSVTGSFMLTDASRNHPPFHRDQNTIMKAGKCTALLEVEFRKSDGGIIKGYGTAFFVTEKHLLTAGHNIVAEDPRTDRISIRIAYPGVKVYDADSSAIRTLDCDLLKTLYTKGDKKIKSKDIAILRCEGLNGGSYLPLSSDPLPSNAVVDIIGYPSSGHHDCIVRHKNDLNDSEASEASSKVLLPTNTLVVTRGTVEKTDAANTNGLISYKVSTCHGMSGSCLLYEGKVYGNIFYKDIHSDIRPSSWTLPGFFGREYRDIVQRPRCP